MKRLLFKPEIWAGDVRAWVKCTVPPSMRDRATALATPLHPTQRSHFSLLFRGLLSASFICTLLFQGEALASNGSPAGVGGQHRARHTGNSGTELTLPVAGIGRGLQAGTHGFATTWPPPLPCTSLHAEQKLCTQRDYSVRRKMWGIKGNELDRHIHQALFWIWMPQF